MELTVQHLDGVKFEVLARGHRLICDQPAGNNGADTGMTPPELLLASLGTCAGYYAVQYLQTRGLATAGLSVRVTAERAVQPARLGSFRIEVNAPGLGERHTAGVLRAVKACLIHSTLVNAPAIQTFVNSDAPEPALQ